MGWWQTLVVALLTYGVTKGVDFTLSFLAEKREFKKYRREKIYIDIEDLKNEVGILVELAANWKSFENKKESYIDVFTNDHELIGKFNKYPFVAHSAREVVHLCKIIASDEKENRNEVHENKKVMHDKYNKFLSICENYIDGLV